MISCYLKEFKEILSETSRSESFTKFRREFIPAVSNHIFRETHIFYPAALEFITDKGQWDDVLKGFGLIQI